MREAGLGLIGLGLIAILGAFLFVDVSREIGYLPYASEYLPRMPREVANVHAMHIQSLVFHGGLISFLAGVVSIAAATIDEAIRRHDPKDESATTVQPTATTAEIAAAAAYRESAQTELDEAQRDPIWPMLVVAALISVVILAFIVTGAQSPRQVTADNVASDILLSNDVVVDDTLMNEDYPNLIE